MNDSSSPSPPSEAAPAACVQTLDKTQRYPYAAGEYVRRFGWMLVERTLFRMSPPRANGWRRMLLRLFGAKIDNAAVNRRTRIWHPWLLTVGEWSNISAGVEIYNLGEVSIGRHTVISQDAYLCAGTHDYRHPTLPLVRDPIAIGDGVWIAAGAFIGPGVTIGNNSVIGARAVVVGDVPPNVVAAGNPCRTLKPRKMA